MDWLGKIQPGTAIAACIFALIIMGGAVWIVAMIAKALTGRSIDLGAFKLGADGKPEKTEDGRLIKLKPAMPDDEFERIANLMAQKVGHICVRGPMLEKLVEGHDVHIDAALAILRDQVDVQGKNGAMGRAKVAEEKHAEEWNAFLKTSALKEEAGA